MRNCLRVLILTLLTTSPVLATQIEWLDASGETVTFETEEAFLEFLKTAEVVGVWDIPVGVTKPKKVLLEANGMSIHAVFRYVDIYEKAGRGEGKFRRHYRDSAWFELAAYRLSRLLGMQSVPPTVKREMDGVIGTLQAWVENSLSERERSEKKLSPPASLEWVRQYQEMWFFDNLIFNEDRNQGNILLDQKWKMWLIDATRAFRPHGRLLNPGLIKTCNRKILERLRSVDPEVIKESLRDVLTHFELEALLKRRVLLLEHIENLIRDRGSESVLFS